jgi:hypothetical protein
MLRVKDLSGCCASAPEAVAMIAANTYEIVFELILIGAIVKPSLRLA